MDLIYYITAIIVIYLLYQGVIYNTYSKKQKKQRQEFKDRTNG